MLIKTKTKQYTLYEFLKDLSERDGKDWVGYYEEVKKQLRGAGIKVYIENISNVERAIFEEAKEEALLYDDLVEKYDLY